MKHWGHRDISRLVAHAKRGWPLTVLAGWQEGERVTPAEVDFVLWAKLGRTIPETCDYINAKRGEAA